MKTDPADAGRPAPSLLTLEHVNDIVRALTGLRPVVYSAGNSVAVELVVDAPTRLRADATAGRRFDWAGYRPLLAVRPRPPLSDVARSSRDAVSSRTDTGRREARRLE